MHPDALSRAIASEPELIPELTLPALLERLTSHRPHRHAIRRWRTSGIVGDDGERKILRSIRIGGRRFVAREDLIEFIQMLATPRERRVSRTVRRSAVERLALEAKL